MEIVRLCEDHIPDVVEMEKLYFSDPWSVNAFLYEIKNPISLWLVAMDADRVVGYIGAQSVLDEADMMNLAVHASYRRQGVAAQLVDALVKELRQKDICGLFLEVRVSNLPAISLYEKLGFTEVGRRPNYYFKPREDALIMRKELTV